jgi:hypothetical protein
MILTLVFVLLGDKEFWSELYNSLYMVESKFLDRDWLESEPSWIMMFGCSHSLNETRRFPNAFIREIYFIYGDKHPGIIIGVIFVCFLLF